MTTTGAIPVWLGIMNGAVLPVDARNHVANLETGHVFVPKAPETLTYDADGNLLSDGRWTYTWDAENRVVKVESRSDTPQASWRRVEWTYDALGRRIRQTTRVWTNNTWAVVEDMKFVSDPTLFGRHIAELNATNNALMRSYVWGLDLSGAMDGAGGVGGLLWVTLHTASGPASGTHFTCYDGNGNVVSLVSATTGDVTARYEYGPFGEPIRVSGPAAALNPFRFSTKRTCNTTDLVLYEYRAYNPVLGRWLSRDPIDEWGGVQLYAFVRNAPSILSDADGRFTYLLHLRITSAAGWAAGISSKCVLKIALASANTDIWHFWDHSYHFTRPVRGGKKEAYRKSMDRMGELLGKVCELAQKGNCREALKSLGTGLHIAQDYYSHVYNGEPVSYDLMGRYPHDDDPNHRNHGRDKDPFQALLATIDSWSILADKKSCLGCCCKN